MNNSTSEAFAARAHDLFIDGESTAALRGAYFDSHDPATGRVVASVAEADASDVDRAVASARRAFESGPWYRMSPSHRARLLHRLADLVADSIDELSLLETMEMGAPRSLTRRLAERASERLRWYGAAAHGIHGRTVENSVEDDVLSYTSREPVGVVGGINPWNGPFVAAVNKVGPALATGCTVVIKAPEDASLSSLRLAELCMEAGVPAGVVNVVTGFGGVAGQALAEHPGVDKVAFTGSPGTGQKIVAASAGNLKRVSLELGGKSPNIIFADADLDAAAMSAAMGVFLNTGQTCVAGTRLFVQRSVHDYVLDRIAEIGRSLRVGSGLDSGTDLGPLVSERQLNRVTVYMDIGAAEGATAVIGGSRLDLPEYRDGFYVPPTVFTNVQDHMRIAREEIFGPVISILPFDDADEVARRANDSPYGLAAGVWTSDVSKAHRLARVIRAGTVWINCYNISDPSMPFGGYKLSGYGRESGFEGLDEYTNIKSTWIKV